MALASGTRLGPYEVIAQIGAGGMGEVYRARDTKLNRDVALKILPEAFTLDGDRIARFRREAQVLASLNHSNIAAIYGFEDSGSTHALVLELVEGPTLADRIATGPISLDEALPIAKQIAEAVEAAHEQGIVHRDLKPANVKLRPDGVVKVLDFGLARALSSSDVDEVALTASPTIASPAMTRLGVILGTAFYMSPEQARGRSVDRGTDIWGWGCVLFEMLTGERPFTGGDTTEIIAAIIRSEPNWSKLPADLPLGVRHTLRRCLEKDPKRRLADLRDARFALEDARLEPPPAPSGARPSSRGIHIAWASVCAASLLIFGGVLWRGRAGAVMTSHEMRLELATPPSTESASLAVSPDGDTLAFVAQSDGRPMLWLRSLVTGESKPLPGTDGATFPFWSPDSRSIGFFSEERLNRIDVDGGALTRLARAPVGTGGTWSREGVILFTLVPDGPLVRMPASGGPTAILPGWNPLKGGYRFPQFLPDGRHFLFYMAEPSVRGVYIGSLESAERQRLIDTDSAATFASPGWLFFVRAGTLFAQRFDETTLTLGTGPVALVKGIAVDSSGVASVSASNAGALAYRVGNVNRQRQLVWFDRTGAQLGDPFPIDNENALNPAISPDGRRLLVSRTVGGNVDIWMLDLERRGALTRLTTEPGPDIDPNWSPDGSRIAYGGLGTGSFALLIKQMTTGETSTVLDTPASEVPVDWSRDGRYLLYRRQADMSSNLELWAVPLQGSRSPINVARGSDVRLGQFSPDGRSVAFESNESGRSEIYVQPFPGPGTKVVVSTDGGRQVRWNRDGKELFYIEPKGRLMSVSLRFRPDGQAEPTSPVVLFQTRVNSVPNVGSLIEYDVAQDGRRFLMNTVVEQTDAPITLVLNWARAN